MTHQATHTLAHHIVLVIGSGAREHALVWKISASPLVLKVFVAPGNAGTELTHENGDGDSKMENVTGLDVSNHEAVAVWCHEHHVCLVVVGPEAPLAEGLADVLATREIACFGPKKNAALIESSKVWARNFMEKHNIPHAKGRHFSDAEKAKEYIKSDPFGTSCCVVKASGLAAGKGVFVCQSIFEGLNAVDSLCQTLKTAAEEIIVEEMLTGFECSLICFSNGSSIVACPLAQDYKRVGENDEGPNTGGMGAYAPCQMADEKTVSKMVGIMEKTAKCMKADGRPFVGALYGGFMVTDSGPMVLEYNCRLGDPETQVILPLIQSDLYEILKSCALEEEIPEVTWKKDVYSVGTVVAMKGYPGSCPKNVVINSLPRYGLLFFAGAKRKDGTILTNGGRVLTCVHVGKTLSAAAKYSKEMANLVDFDGAFFRSDIALKGVGSSILRSGFLTYANSGVDIETADAFVNHLKTKTLENGLANGASGLGGFAGLLKIQGANLAACTDGVGTKLFVAEAMQELSTIGIDLVAMSVNDLLCSGAKPVAFLDYLAVGKLEKDRAANIIQGVLEGCKQANCRLIGGETAEMPGLYAPGHFDLAGFSLGEVVDRELPLSDSIKPGDLLIGLPSSGVHANGFSLVRKILNCAGLSWKSSAEFLGNGESLGSYFLTPTKIYVQDILPVLPKLKALAHITGGGIPGNLSRVLGEGMSAKLDALSWKVPSVFAWMSAIGGISSSELLKTFNMGLGMIAVVAAEHAEGVVTQLNENVAKDCLAKVVGRIEANTEASVGEVEVKNVDRVLNLLPYLEKPFAKIDKRVAVLISGNGSNLQALIDYTESHWVSCGAKIRLVISNKPDAYGLQRAKDACISTEVVSHVGRSRVDFEKDVHAILCQHKIDIVCLAGFMRILTDWFISQWKGCILNIHPSLLPSFKGRHAVRDALAFGATVTGATVHFVECEVDAGPIVLQGACNIEPGDSEETLINRIHGIEHIIFPKALELVASERLVMQEDGSVLRRLTTEK